MDHLPRVQHPVYPRLEVPYFCSETYAYDGKGDLFDFPLRVGFSFEQFPKFLRGEYLPMTWNEALSFLQEWAFFGLLSETLHTRFPEHVHHPAMCTGHPTNFIPHYTRY